MGTVIVGEPYMWSIYYPVGHRVSDTSGWGAAEESLDDELYIGEPAFLECDAVHP